MKKFLSTLTAAVCVMACAFSFAACGGDNSGGDKTHTTHNWSATYTQDGDRHYQTCDGCNEKQYSNHDYGASGVCVCGKEKPVEIHTHNWSTTYTQDGDRHYQTCGGCDEKQYNNHDYGASGVCVCGKQKPVTVIAVESVTLNKTEITLEINETETLTATLTPDNATDKTVTWTVAPSGVVSVENGVITALKDGTATVTATANGKSANCTVTVNAPLTNAQVLRYLNDNVLMGLVKSALPSSWEINNNNVTNATWYITKDGDKITCATLSFVYLYGRQDNYVTICKAEFPSGLTSQNIFDNKNVTPTYSRIYRNSIDPTIQAEHTDLTNAICDKLFGAKTNSTRYIIDHGGNSLDSQLGNALRYTVIEITDTNIKEQRIHISYASTDSGLITNLADSTKYYIPVYGKNIAIMGVRLEDNAEPFFGKVTPLGDKVTGEQLKTVFNAGYREKAIEYQLGKTYTGNIYDEAWYVTKSEKTGNIISSTFAFYYKEGTQTRFYKYTFIFRLRPFTYDDYLNAMNGDYADIAVDSENTTHYTIEDTAPKNTEHSALVNAVMNKFRNEWNLTSNAVAEFKSLSYKAWTTINGVENVEVRTLTMTIYDGDTWVDVKLIIKYASNDSEYITNLNNNLYKPFDNRYGSSKNSYSHSAWVEQVTTVNGEKL